MTNVLITAEKRRKEEDHPRIRADPRDSRMHALYFSFFIFFFLTAHRPSIFPSPAVIGLRKKYLPPLEADRNWISARARARVTIEMKIRRTSRADSLARLFVPRFIPRCAPHRSAFPFKNGISIFLAEWFLRH